MAEVERSTRQPCNLTENTEDKELKRERKRG